VKTDFLCPYCFDVNSLSDVVYHCVNCNTDTKVDDLVGSDASGYAFPVSIICPKCGTSALASCPSCKGTLPEGTLSGGDSIISIVGTRGSGKSHYIAVLIYELYRRVAADFDASFAGYGNSHALWAAKFGNRLYSALQALDATAVGSKDEQKPLIYELLFPATDGGENILYTFVFYDTAGENFSDENQMLLLNRYICHSAGIICILDPFQIPDLEYKIDRDIVDGSSSGAAITSNMEVINHVASLIRNYKGMRRSERIDIPVALVFTKLDAIEGLIPNGSTVLDVSPHIGGVDDNDIHNVDAEIKSLLLEWGERAFIQLVDSSFSNTEYFAVSALGLGNHPDATKNRTIRKPQPHRVEDPFLWLLRETGVLDEQCRSERQAAAKRLRLIPNDVKKAREQATEQARLAEQKRKEAERLAQERKQREDADRREQERLTEEQRRKAERRKAQWRKRIPAIVVVIIIAIVAATIYYNTVTEPEEQYNEAMILYNQGRYDSARYAFEELDDYKNSYQMVELCLTEKRIQSLRYSDEELELNDTPDTAQGLLAGVYQQGNLSAPYENERDWYAFNLRDTREVSIAFQTTEIDADDAYWDVYLYEGYSAAISENGTIYYHEFIPGRQAQTYIGPYTLYPGIYYLRVESSDGWSSDPYVILLSTDY
jgi:TolA-binding protein